MRLLTIFSFLIILSLIYLNRTYAYFYNSIGKYQLKNPNEIKKNIILNNPAGNKDMTYVAMGDSLTAGVGADSIEESYAYLYAKNLSKDYSILKVINLATPGAQVKDLLNNQVPQAIKEKPNFVTILIGTNDIHNKTPIEDFEKLYRQAVQELKDKVSPQITLITIPYLASNKITFFPYTILLDMQTKQFNNSIKNICTSKSVKCIDLYQTTAHFNQEEDNYSIDEFHPSSKGYLLWSQYLNANSN